MSLRFCTERVLRSPPLSIERETRVVDDSDTTDPVVPLEFEGREEFGPGVKVHDTEKQRVEIYFRDNPQPYREKFEAFYAHPAFTRIIPAFNEGARVIGVTLHVFPVSIWIAQISEVPERDDESLDDDGELIKRTYPARLSTVFGPRAVADEKDGFPAQNFVYQPVDVSYNPLDPDGRHESNLVIELSPVYSLILSEKNQDPEDSSDDELASDQESSVDNDRMDVDDDDDDEDIERSSTAARRESGDTFIQYNLGNSDVYPRRAFGECPLVGACLVSDTHLAVLDFYLCLYVIDVSGTKPFYPIYVGCLLPTERLHGKFRHIDMTSPFKHVLRIRVMLEGAAQEESYIVRILEPPMLFGQHPAIEYREHSITMAFAQMRSRNFGSLVELVYPALKGTGALDESAILAFAPFDKRGNPYDGTSTTRARAWKGNAAIPKQVEHFLLTGELLHPKISFEERRFLKDTEKSVVCELILAYLGFFTAALAVRRFREECYRPIEDVDVSASDYTEKTFRDNIAFWLAGLRRSDFDPISRLFFSSRTKKLTGLELLREATLSPDIHDVELDDLEFASSMHKALAKLWSRFEVKKRLSNTQAANLSKDFGYIVVAFDPMALKPPNFNAASERFLANWAIPRSVIEHRWPYPATAAGVNFATFADAETFDFIMGTFIANIVPLGYEVTNESKALALLRSRGSSMYDPGQSSFHAEISPDVLNYAEFPTWLISATLRFDETLFFKTRKSLYAIIHDANLTRLQIHASVCRTMKKLTRNTEWNTPASLAGFALTEFIIPAAEKLDPDDSAYEDEVTATATALQYAICIGYDLRFFDLYEKTADEEFDGVAFEEEIKSQATAFSNPKLSDFVETFLNFMHVDRAVPQVHVRVRNSGAVIAKPTDSQ